MIIPDLTKTVNWGDFNNITLERVVVRKSRRSRKDVLKSKRSKRVCSKSSVEEVVLITGKREEFITFINITVIQNK